VDSVLPAFASVATTIHCVVAAVLVMVTVEVSVGSPSFGLGPMNGHEKSADVLVQEEQAA